MPDIETWATRIGELDTGIIDIHGERCVGVRNRKASCSACIDACPTGAVTVYRNVVSIDPDACSGCGACTAVCPTEALLATEPTEPDLIDAGIRAMDANDATPVFACTRYLKKRKHDVSRVVELPCLARLDETFLIGLVAGGAKEVVLITGMCDECEWSSCATVVNTMAERANELLALWKHEPSIVQADALPANVAKNNRHAEPALRVEGGGRRDFFSQIKTGATGMVGKAALSALNMDEAAAEPSLRDKLTSGSSGLTKYLPGRQTLLLDSLEQLGHTDVETLDTGLWATMSIDMETCNKCRKCAFFCPTDALKEFKIGKKDYELEFLAVDCVNCRLCEDSCLHDSITLETRVPVRTLLDCDVKVFDFTQGK